MKNTIIEWIFYGWGIVAGFFLVVATVLSAVMLVREVVLWIRRAWRQE